MVTIELPDETAAALEAQAAAAGLDLQGYLAEVARSAVDSRAAPLDDDEWLKLWQKAVDSVPPSDHFVDDSRESIYPDRS
jgi:hypothetical protein